MLERRGASLGVPVKAGAAFVIAFALLYAWRHFWLHGGTPGSDCVGDAMRYYLPNLLFTRDALFEGRLPLWNPFEMLGMPMMATLEYGPFYPPNWLYFVLPLRMAHISVAGLHLALLGVFTFAYLRSSLRVGVSAAVFGGFVMAFSSWSVLHMASLPDIYHGAVWIPLILLLADRLIACPGFASIGWLAAAIALQFFAGEAEISSRTGLLLVAYAAARLVQQAWLRRSLPVASFAGLCAAALLAAGLCAVQLLPTAELSLHSVRAPGGLEFATAFRGELGTPSDAIKDIVLDRNAGKLLYVGILPLMLCLYAFRKVRFETVFFAACGAVAFELLRGEASPLAWIYYRYVPTGNWFQCPIRFAPFLLFPVALLSALGIDGLAVDAASVREARQRSRFLPVLYSALVAVVLYCLSVFWNVDDAAVPLLGSLLLLILVSSACVAPLVPKMRLQIGTLRPWALCAVCIFPLAMTAWTRYPVADFNVPEKIDLAGIAPPVSRFLQGNCGHGERIYADFATPDGRRVPKLGPLLEVPCINGQSPFTSPAFWDLVRPYRSPRLLKGDAAATRTLQPVGLWGGLALESGAQEILNLLGVKYIVLGLGNEFFLPFKKNWIEKAVVPSTLSAALTADTVTVFENKEKWPRAFVVTGTDTPDLASIKMLGKEGLLAAPITEYSPHRLSIQAPPGARGVLVLTDQYYPGWRATLNGKPVGIERIAGIFRGVRVDGAGGTLVFLYRPSSFRLGAIISSVTLLFTFAGIALSLRFPAPIRT